ncbi:MAG: family 20 glycosylhydrolase, partial [Pseudomonadales bacterium]|nr:family 20 glycosylhydrolase [Pseudomonadales bacterium]
HLYLDMPYTLGMQEPGLPWANYVDTEDIYRFDPQANWDLDAHANVIGIQAQLWTETVFTSELLDYYLFPRLLAVAERAWNAQPDPGSWPAFYSALSETEINHLLELGIQPRPLKAQA